MDYIILITIDTLQFITAPAAATLVSILLVTFILLVMIFRAPDARFAYSLFSVLGLVLTGILFLGLTMECEGYQVDYIKQVQNEIHEDYKNGVIPKVKHDQAVELAIEIKRMGTKGYYSNANYGHVKSKVEALAQPINNI